MKTHIRIALLLASLCTLGAAVANAAPAAPKAPQKVPVATCNDGKTMFGTDPHEHRGACSGHGGVASWADGSPVKSHGKRTEYK